MTQIAITLRIFSRTISRTPRNNEEHFLNQEPSVTNDRNPAKDINPINMKAPIQGTSTVKAIFSPLLEIKDITGRGASEYCGFNPNILRLSNVILPVSVRSEAP